jgi:penicillin-binding protein 2
MHSVMNDRRGTAYGSRVVVDGLELAGKTGTAQVLNRVVRNDEVPWEERDHALFVNFAPYDTPKIAVSVVVEHGGGGSSAAAPIGRDVTLQALYGETPPLDAYPSSQRSRIQAQQERLERERRQRRAEGRSRA